MNSLYYDQYVPQIATISEKITLSLITYYWLIKSVQLWNGGDFVNVYNLGAAVKFNF